MLRSRQLSITASKYVERTIGYNNPTLYSRLARTLVKSLLTAYITLCIYQYSSKVWIALELVLVALVLDLAAMPSPVPALSSYSRHDQVKDLPVG